METLSSDMAGLMSSKRSSASILDIVGADVNSSYDRAMQVQVLSDTFHLSAGGQTFGGNFNIQVQLRDDNAIHYLKKSGLLFEYVSDGGSYPANMPMLFTGLELSIGNVVLSTPFQHFYVQQKISKMKAAQIDKYARGIVIKTRDFSYLPAVRINAGAYEAFVPLQTHGGAANPIVPVYENSTLSNQYNAVHRMQTDHFSLLTELDDAGVPIVKAFVPFNLIFPCIDELPDDGAAFTGYGQSIKMNIRTNLGADFLSCFNPLAQPPSYQIRNMQLVKIFSKLDQPRTDLLLKANVTLPLCKYVHYQGPIQGQTLNAIYSISKDDLIQSLYFAFHHRTQAGQTAETTNLLANLVNATACQFKTPLSYFLQMPITQIDLIIGGDPITISEQNIQALHVMDSITDEPSLYQTPVLRQTRWAYKLDLRRFSDDLFGSSAKQTTTVQLRIQFKVGAGSRTICGQSDDWSNALLGNYQFYSYLETLSFVDLKNGVYQSK